MSISDRISALSPQQRELLATLRRKSAAARPPSLPPPIARRPPGDSWPLALDQERLWFLFQLDPDDASYNLPTVTRLRGRLHPEVMSSVMDEIVRRHEAWRTSFPEEDGRPVQVIAPPTPVPFPLIDLSGLPEAAREAEAAREREAAGRRPFDLRQGPLLRILLVRLAADLHDIVLVVHHIVSDWYSSVLFWGEVEKLYPAVLAGRPAALPELPVQYADFAIWQREVLSGPALQPHLDYWIQHLEGAPAALELPTDRPRPAHFTTRGERVPFRMSRDTSSALKSLAQRERVTPFMLMLALFQTLLSRWSGQDRVLVSSPNANRHRDELQPLLGFFLTQLVFSTDLGGDPTFQEVLGRVRQVALAAYAHQDVPFGKLVEALRPERDTSRPPIAQVDLLLLDTGDAKGYSFGNLDVSPVDVDTGTAAFELTLGLWDSTAGYFGSLEYNADLFDAATGGRLAEGFLALLDAVLARVDAPLSALPVQGEGAAHQALIEWNDTGASFPQTGERLQDRFFARAAQTPEALAVIDGKQRLTYAELADRAKALAEHLRQMGIGAEDRVAVRLPRSADLVTALLGVLASGAAYVPVDPAWPEERREMVVADAGAAVVLEEAGFARTLTPWPPLPHALTPARERGNPSEDRALAYLIYTSGSTGRPKAVGIEHRSAVAFLAWAAEHFADELAGGVLASTSVSFDLSVFEIFGPLSCGGTVILAENALALPELPAAGEVGLINTVPSALTELLRLGDLPASVRTVNLAGEVLPRRLAEELFRSAPSVRLFNLYGPSEDTTYSTWAEVTSEDLAEPAIGRPVTGTRAFLLDRELRPVPLGGRGELCLAGDGLARGYLGRPELTAERFVPDAQSVSPGERLYRTGDLARWRAHGELELLGRADRQVKVRGFRVEPAEIEILLRSHPEVQDVAVAVYDGRLAAWVVPRNETAPDLRGFLIERLPRHMVPALWSTLSALPLTPNGKTDYRALPNPDVPVAGTAGSAPRTPVEEKLAAIWAEVLGIPRVGIQDNFFRLGGDSILSIRVVARARQEGLGITPRQIFERQTVAELGAVATPLGSAKNAREEGPVTGDAALTPIQRWFLETDPVDPHHYNQAVFLETRGPVEDGWLRRAIAGLLEHHDALRLRFTGEQLTEKKSWFTAPPAEPPVTRFDLSALPEALHRATLEDAAAQVQASLDLAAGPLVRAAFFDLGPERSGRLLLVIHHLVVDGVSWRILLEDLQSFPDLAPKTTSWQQWAERLGEHAQSAEALAEAETWLGLVETWSEPLPVDSIGGIGGDDSEASGGVVSVSLAPEATRSLLRDAGAAWRTRPDDLLLAAVAHSFSVWTGSPRLVLWLEGHGREEIVPDADLSRTVGWFTSLSPAALDLVGVEEPGAVIRRVKEALRALPRRGIGYGLLRWLGHPDISARLAARREPEVVFNYLGQLDLVLPEGSRFAPAEESSGSPRSPRAARRHRIEINAGVVGGRLEVHWGYGRNVHERATIETLAQRFLSRLETLIAACLAPGAGGLTPSDVPLARLGQEVLDRIAGGRLVGDGPTIEDLYPLSPMQAGFLFHGLYAPATEIYFEQITCILRGDLDAVAFRRAWQRLLDRHGILRTAFLWEGLDEPLQAVHRGVEVPWIEEDWRGTADLDTRLAAFTAADRQQPFDLRRAPLLRVALLRTAEREHRVIWSFHHLLLDGWSLPQLFAELFALYAEQPLPAPALPYRDFVAWLERRDQAEDERYWRQALAGLDGPTPLPWDAAEAAPSTRADEFTQHEVLLPENATAALEALARERGLTLNTVVQGAWALLLARWSGEPEVVFGAVAAGRPPELPGFESALGLFINTLPVRLDADSSLPLAAWLGAHQSAQIEARQHEHAPLAEVQRWSGLSAREPLFHSLLVFENYPLDSAVADVGSLELDSVEAVERTSYPLSLAAIPGRRLRLRITHDRHLEPSTGGRLLGWLIRLLERFPNEPERAPRDFELLSETERARILEPGDGVQEITETALQRFERQAAATPDAPAVRDASESLSFSELDRRAEQYAGELLSRGAGPGSVVPLEAERSARALVGMLGTWKAGAAWVAIDPSRPAPPAPSPQGSLAYVLYTSGSTGTPKGVLVDHAALAHYLAWVDEVLLAPIGHHLPATSGLTFDASLKQLLGPLLAGREVRILSEDTATRPVDLAYALAAEGFRAWNGVPSLWSAVLDAIEMAGVPRPEALERVLLGGEALAPALVERTRRLLPRVEIWNLYGPTEATANATAARLAPGEQVHLGGPLPGTRTYVLDRAGRLVPPGTAGELCLAGVGLARGYLDRPDLTAERFLPDPFSNAPGERLYRTGDLVRRSADGHLEHRGRVDSQVKVRGMRLELGEIEAVLRSHPEVRDAAVTAGKTERKDASDEIRLAAWIETAGEVAAPDLKIWLRGLLPAAAVPADLVILPALPRLPNGKADRRALAALAPEKAESSRPFEAPANEVEEKLADLWRDLLKIERAGRSDNFFDLGGHSLLATRLMVRIRDAFGVSPSLASIFEAADLAALAGEILALRLHTEHPDDLAHMMAELDGLSDEEVEALLAEEALDQEEPS